MKANDGGRRAMEVLLTQEQAFLAGLSHLYAPRIAWIYSFHQPCAQRAKLKSRRDDIFVAPGNPAPAGAARGYGPNEPPVFSFWLCAERVRRTTRRRKQTRLSGALPTEAVASRLRRSYGDAALLGPEYRGRAVVVYRRGRMDRRGPFQSATQSAIDWLVSS